MSDDFVHWDDLDLDYFLGKYTDDESGALVEAESSDSDSGLRTNLQQFAPQKQPVPRHPKQNTENATSRN